MILKNTLFLAMLLTFIPAAQADTDKGTKAKDMTCEDFLAVDYETIPVVVGYLYSYNEWDGYMDSVPVDAIEDVDVSYIVNYCQKNPTAKVSSATKKK